jgi:Fe-S-cluster containining protein
MVIMAKAAVQEHKEGDDPLPDIIKDLAAFPYDLTESGGCSQLNPGGFCNVYQTRPVVCNTDSMFEKYWSTVMTKEEYYRDSMASCNKLHAACGYNRMFDTISMSGKVFNVIPKEG